MDISIGFIGLGARGKGLLESVVLPQGEKITVVCDSYEDRLTWEAEQVIRSGQPAPAQYRDYRDVINDKNVNTVIIATAWESHADIALAAMNAGKAVALEVGGAYSLKQCYDLVEAIAQEAISMICAKKSLSAKRIGITA